ncbi:MAG: hypothetical protein RI942_1606 [Pseudomonadota bacterium]
MALNQEITANWADVSRMLDEVLLLGGSDRAEYLVHLNARSPTLAVILARLLEIEKGLPVGFLEQGPAVDMQMAPLAELSEGSEVGGYRLLRPLGRGGMGSVWIAERSDGALKRKVALKLPRLPWVEGLTTQLVSERDILCALEHPNIARLYDAGLDASGQPFIAMEYIEGESIDVFCDKQTLTIHARVELFLQVLKAVQFAHSRLVIHRDLKPANILVNSRGEAHLLDFGIAQLQSQNTVAQSSLPFDSASQIHALTLRYASPEQIRKERLTVAADIYSLGVTLFELLLGETPYDTSITDKEKLREAVLAGRRKLPAHTSVTAVRLESRKITRRKLQKLMASDLGAIIEKATKSDPVERYPSVEAFAVDLQRWLTIKPVLAVRSSPWRSISKFIQRNPWPTAIATCSVSVISALAIVATLNAERARAESIRANTTKDFLLSIFDAANPALHGGREISARELLAFGEAGLKKNLGGEPDIRVNALNSLIEMTMKIGDVVSARRLSRERSEAYAIDGKYQLEIDSLLTEAQLALLENDFVSISYFLDRIEYLSRDLRLSSSKSVELASYRGWLNIDSGALESAYSEFLKIRDYSEKNYSSKYSVTASRGMAAVKFLEGDSEAGFHIINSKITDLSALEVKGENLKNYKLQLIYDLYRFGEYNKGWELLEKEVNRARSENEITDELSAIWVKWCIKKERYDDLVLWISQRDSIESDFDGDWSLTRARVLTYLGEHESARLILDELSIDAERDKALYLDFLITKFELIYPDREFKEVRLPEADPTWLKIRERDRFYREYYSGVVYASRGEFSQAASAFERAKKDGSAQLGPSHPTVANFALAGLVARVADEFMLPNDLEIDAVLSTLGRAYGVESEKYAKTVRWVRDTGTLLASNARGSDLWKLYDPRL